MYIVIELKNMLSNIVCLHSGSSFLSHCRQARNNSQIKTSPWIRLYHWSAT